MPSQEQQLREIARIERLKTLGNWALCLGLLTLVSSVGVAGFGGLGNPKNWSNMFAAMAGEGLLRWGVIPLIAAGLALIIVGAILTASCSPRDCVLASVESRRAAAQQDR